MLDTASGGQSPNENEDWVGATPHTVMVLDGLSAPEGVGGCYHGTPWYVARLGPRILAYAASPETTLRSALAVAIEEVADLHRESCDLQNVGTPSTTVAMARHNTASDMMEALVLADSPVVLETGDDRVEILSDTRVEEVVPKEHKAALASPVGPERDRRIAELVRAQREVRNVPNGYWVAQADAAAAEYALTKTWPQTDIRRLAVLTDGASRMVDVFKKFTWSRVLDLLDDLGPSGLIAETRRFEAQDPQGETWPRYKECDDATVAYWKFQ